MGSGPRQAGCGKGSAAFGAAGDPGTAGPTRPSPALPPAGRPPRPPAALPAAPARVRRPHATRAAAEHVPRRGRSHRRYRSPGAPCGRLGHGGQRRADGPGCWWRRRRWRRQGREAATEGAGAATPPGWPARHGDAAAPPRPAPPRSPRPARVGHAERLHARPCGRRDRTPAVPRRPISPPQHPHQRLGKDQARPLCPDPRSVFKSCCNNIETTATVNRNHRGQ